MQPVGIHQGTVEDDEASRRAGHELIIAIQFAERAVIYQRRENCTPFTSTERSAVSQGGERMRLLENSFTLERNFGLRDAIESKTS